MSAPYVGEIRMFGGNFAPAGWKTCDGELLPISEYDTLFNLIGTTYGGDGQNTFALPNLAARLPIHVGSNGTSTYTLAENGGVTSVTVNTNQIPAHSHSFLASGNTAGNSSPSNNTVGAVGATQIYHNSNPTSAMAANLLSPAGGSQPHDNMQPYLAISYIISLFGVYPSPT